MVSNFVDYYWIFQLCGKTFSFVSKIPNLLIQIFFPKIIFSSRFTDSKKYETDFIKCFQLESPRKGEICNACVLLVKRFKRLPAGSTRHWGHVVDARVGPGLKSMTKFKKRREEQDGTCPPTKKPAASLVPERFSKIFKKTKKKDKKTFDSKKETSSLGGSSDEASTPPSPSESHSDDYDNANDMIFGKKIFKFKNQQTIQQKNFGLMSNSTSQRSGFVSRKHRRKSAHPYKNRKPLSMNINMLDEISKDNLWVKLHTCCGMVYECVLYGAVIVDVNSYSPCTLHARNGHEQVDETNKILPVLNKISKVSDLISNSSAGNSTVAMKKTHLFMKRQQEQQMLPHNNPVIVCNVDNGNAKTDSSSNSPATPDPLQISEPSQSSLSTNENSNIFINQTVEKSLQKANSDSMKFVKTPLAVGNPLANNIKNIINYNGISEKNAVNGGASTLKAKIGQGLANIMKCTAGNENSSDSGYEEIAQEMRKINVPPQNLVYATALVGLSQAPVITATPLPNSYSTEAVSV